MDAAIRRAEQMKILLIGEQPLFALGLLQTLHAIDSRAQLESAGSIDQGLALAATKPDFDIVLVDLHLSEGNAVEGLQSFREHVPRAARVLLIDSGSLEIGALARQAGVSAYLSKALTLKEMRSALGGIVGLAADSDHAASGHIGRARGSLTPRQFEVLELVAQGMPNKRIAAALGIAERTVKLHITALMGLVGARNRTHLLVRARQERLL
jgi:DNA-binding NarL/FixJ family response regulator